MRRRLLPILFSGSTPATPPAQPTGLTATPITTARIDLAWTDAASDETAYKVYRSTNGTDYAQVGIDQAAGTQAYSDTTVTAGVKYWYKVAAVNAGGETLSAAATANTLTLTISAYWKLDESSAGAGAVTRNESVGVLHLTDNGTTPSGIGKISSCIDAVAANNEYLSRASAAALVVGDIDFMFAAWVNPDDLTNNWTILAKDNTATREYTLRISVTTGNIAFNVSALGASSTVFNSGLPVVAGVWSFVVAWHDSVNNVVGVQVNDSAPATQAHTTGVFTGTADFRIGSQQIGGVHYNGLIDEVGMWKRILTTGERTALYNGGTGITYPFA
jgi:hypothetical protein